MRCDRSFASRVVRASDLPGPSACSHTSSLHSPGRLARRQIAQKSPTIDFVETYSCILPAGKVHALAPGLIADIGSRPIAASGVMTADPCRRTSLDARGLRVLQVLGILIVLSGIITPPVSAPATFRMADLAGGSGCNRLRPAD